MNSQSPTVYDKEFYTSLGNIAELLRLGFMLGSLVFGAFMFLLIGGASGNFEITEGMLLFYFVLSYSAGFGTLVAFFCLEHPNKWVRWSFFAILFAIPSILYFIK